MIFSGKMCVVVPHQSFCRDEQRHSLPLYGLLSTLSLSPTDIPIIVAGCSRPRSHHRHRPTFTYPMSPSSQSKNVFSIFVAYQCCVLILFGALWCWDLSVWCVFGQLVWCMEGDASGVFGVSCGSLFGAWKEMYRECLVDHFFTKKSDPHLKKR